MSDAPDNPDRAWDAGLRDNDLIAFIATFDGENGPVPADKAVFFTARALRDSVSMSKVGQPKSASEGAERDRNWPTTVPKRAGKVISVTAEKIVTQMLETDELSARKQTYTLRGKTPYVQPGDNFQGLSDIIAGAPSQIFNLDDYATLEYHPLDEVASENEIDRYAAAKSLRYREENIALATSTLEDLISNEQEDRVKLEAAGSAAFLGSALGEDTISQFIWDNDTRPDLRMEAVLVVTELAGSEFGHQVLNRVAHEPLFNGHEMKQAAIWGLGKMGLRSYADIVPFIADEEENVALHAIGAFGPDTPQNVVDSLIRELAQGDQNLAPAISEVLSVIENDDVYSGLIQAARSNPTEWVIATLGRLSAEKLRNILGGDPLLEKIAPMLLLSDQSNWLASESARTDMNFLLKQNL
ncbi:MAG: hypothetical protein AAF483_18930 [Planctomycetota bacterium]